jgi:YfiH family protein
MSQTLDLITPDWPAPARVRAVSTTRHGGVSRAPYDSLNLAEHVGDEAADVRANRARLSAALGVAEPPWLRQVHGYAVVDAAYAKAGDEADGAMAFTSGPVCAVMTADCLPILLCDEQGDAVAALHAGWRGLASGIIESGVQGLARPPGSLLAWLGPAIGPDAFEVGEDVFQTFCTADPEAAPAFRPTRAGKWNADMYMLAQRRLRQLGVSRIYGGGVTRDWCTHRDRARFYSFRRDGTTGRMATLVWLEAGR